ncbi:MAG: helix-turn-helix domain-containing protein, partial [Solirubrobacteraceae bacterium]
LWPPDVDVRPIAVGSVAAVRAGKYGSVDVRVVAVAAYLAGEGSTAIIAQRFGVPRTTLTMWVRQTRLTAA